MLFPLLAFQNKYSELSWATEAVFYEASMLTELAYSVEYEISGELQIWFL